MFVDNRKGLYHIRIQRFKMVLNSLSLIIHFDYLIKDLRDRKIDLGLHHGGLQFDFRRVHFLFIILELLSFEHFFSQVFATSRQNDSNEFTVGNLVWIKSSYLAAEESSELLRQDRVDGLNVIVSEKASQAF